MALAVWTRDLIREAGQALRLLTRAPGFAAVALTTLALGIGAPAAIFSIVHAVLLRPLPYPEPDRLVSFRIEAATPRGPFAFDALPASEALTWGAEAATLSSMALYNGQALTLATLEGPFRLLGITATPNLFSIVGVEPALGRTFEPASRDARQVVLAFATWQRYFHADRSVLGSTVMFDGAPYVVTGVMPRDFAFPDPDTAFWVPLLIDAGGTRGMVLPAIARLRPGATVAAVQQEGTRRLQSDGPRERQTLVVRTMQEQMVGGVRRLLWIFMAAVGLVFVVATANIALLLLTRGTARQREFSVRLALGAGRARLTRQLLVEAAVLSGLGGLIGVGLASLSVTALLHAAPREIPRLRDASLDGTVLAFAAVLSIATSVVYGVLSAGRAVIAAPVRALGRLGGDAHLAGTRRSRRRLNLLAAAELALTMVLLVGAGLLLRSFVRLLLVDQGFDPRDAVALQVTLPGSRYPTPAARLAFHERLLERLRATPGIDEAGITASMPNRQPSARMSFTSTAVDPSFDPMTTPVADTRTVSEGFFKSMGVPIRAGREFRAEDAVGSEPVIVISERLAQQQFPGRDAVGQLLHAGLGGSRRVIGVVGDVRPAAGGNETATAAYLPMRQDEGVFRWFATATVVVRGRDVDVAAKAVRALVLSLDADMPPFNVRSLSDEVSGLVAGPRFSASLLGLFAVVALVMATVGVYGVIAYGARQRTQEIGIRVALGATRRQVLRLVIRDGLVIVLLGLAAGLTLAVWLARTLTGLLHEVTPADPTALASVAAILLTAGLLAAFVPARRATRVSALDALRDN